VFSFVLNNIPHKKGGKKIVEKMCKRGLKILVIFEITRLKFNDFLSFPQVWKREVKNGKF